MREIALFVVPEEFTLDLTEPWQLQLLVQRNVGARDKSFLTFDLAHASRQVSPQHCGPERGQAPSPHPRHATRSFCGPVPERRGRAPRRGLDEPLWVKIWKTNTVSVAITGAGLGALDLIFFFQDGLSAADLSTSGCAGVISLSFSCGSAGMRTRSYPS